MKDLFYSGSPQIYHIVSIYDKILECLVFSRTVFHQHFSVPLLSPANPKEKSKNSDPTELSLKCRKDNLIITAQSWAVYLPSLESKVSVTLGEKLKGK